MKLKSLLCTLLTGALLLPLAACNGGQNPSDSEGNTDPSGSATTTVSTADNPTASLPENATLTEKIAWQSEHLTDSASIAALRTLIWQEYAEKVAADEPARATEIQKNKISTITINRTKMKIQTKVVGKAPADGYPVFLVYHGGGYDPSGSTNESQWSGMAERYTASRVPAIYISIRSISDNESSGQIFSTDISWKFYDRIIEDCILYMNANPNKAYIVGYSAGGNGVYQIAPIITDRLASATMTAGHPEGIDLTNLYNLPFYLNVGELDNAYSRNTITVEYSVKLDELAKRYGGGYEHQCFVHAGKEHGVVGDNATSKQTVVKDLDAWYTTTANTDAARLMTSHTRNPLPERIVYNTTTTKKSQRGIDSFYWLSTTLGTGTLDVSFDKETNTFSFQKTLRMRSGEVTIYLSEDMVDVFSTVKVITKSGRVLEYTPEISLDVLRQTTAERGDPNYQFCAKITLTAAEVNG